MGCFSTPKAPAPDPLVSQSMMEQARLSAEQFQFLKDVYGANQQRQQALDDMALEIGRDMLRDSQLNRQRASEQYDFYMRSGRPLEERFLADAWKVGGEAERADARGRAASDVAQAFSNAQQQSMRSMGRYGIRPNAERMATISQNIAAQQAAAQAGAITNADAQERARGEQARATAVNVARGMPASTIQFGSLAGQQGQAAFSNQHLANQSAMGFQNQMAGAYGSAANIHGNIAQQGASLYGNQIQAWNAAANQRAQGAAGFGQLVGIGLMSSSKKAKEGSAPVDDQLALEGLRKTKVQSWRYKDGDGRRQIGPMAEDLQAALGDAVAPGGQMIDVVSNLGVHHSAIRALADRLDRLEGKSSRSSAFADGGLVGEAKRDIRARSLRINDAVDAMSEGRPPPENVPERAKPPRDERPASEQVRERTREAINKVRKAIGFGDGGPVRGPGTGVSDSIPARLSAGEYVIPADVVRAKGVEFFDRLTEKYHTPAAIQRARGQK